jgi:hypothetical protein
MRYAKRGLIAIGLLVRGASAHAQESTQPAIVHGFASWSYGRTSDNNYLAGTRQGEFRDVSMAINLAKSVTEQLSIHAQGETAHVRESTTTDLDYAFADYKLNDRISFRIGQVKHPFGIYTDVFDVGTLRPFLDLPQGFYGPAGFAGESYTGVGVSGTEDVGAWSVAYDAYAGGNDLERFAVPERFFRPGASIAVAGNLEQQANRNVVGGRVVLQTPLRGLSVGGSSYTGTVVEAAGARFTVFAGQLAYRTNALTLESEIAHASEVGDEQTTGGYVLAAYRLTPEWQVGAQYDNLSSQFVNANVAAAPSLQHHREGALVLSRWMTRAFVIKAEYHHVNGNRLAAPNQDELNALVAAKALHLTTHLVQFGAQIAF